MAKKPDTSKPQGSGKDAESDVFMREVDEALREDQLLMFWKKYGLASIAVVAVGLAGLAGWLVYQSNVEEAAGVKSEEFITALDAIQRGNLDGAKNALQPLKSAEQKGYKALARLTEAGILQQQNKSDEAAKSFADIAGDESLPQEYRDLALIRQTLIEFDKMAPAKVIERLKPLAVPGGPWFGSAGEMVAIAYMKMNKPELAGPIFAEMAKAEELPPTIRDRAGQMAGLLGIDTVNLEEKSKDEEAAAE